MSSNYICIHVTRVPLLGQVLFKGLLMAEWYLCPFKTSSFRESCWWLGFIYALLGQIVLESFADAV